MLNPLGDGGDDVKGQLDRVEDREEPERGRLAVRNASVVPGFLDDHPQRGLDQIGHKAQTEGMQRHHQRQNLRRDRDVGRVAARAPRLHGDEVGAVLSKPLWVVHDCLPLRLRVPTHQAGGGHAFGIGIRAVVNSEARAADESIQQCQTIARIKRRVRDDVPLQGDVSGLDSGVGRHGRAEGKLDEGNRHTG